LLWVEILHIQIAAVNHNTGHGYHLRAQECQRVLMKIPMICEKSSRYCNSKFNYRIF
jgi:hypothetical protein